MGLSKNRGTPKWMVKIMENPMNKWMIWGFSHYFWFNTQIYHPTIWGFHTFIFFDQNVDQRPSFFRWWWTRQELALLWIKRCGSISRPGKGNLSLAFLVFFFEFVVGKGGRWVSLPKTMVSWWVRKEKIHYNCKKANCCSPLWKSQNQPEFQGMG